MKQIVVISGKGGTGKTVITGAFAALAKNKVVADCDVDAADMHLLLDPVVTERHEFRSGKTAVIDSGTCTACGRCIDACRFDAVKKGYSVDPVSCEGCAFCAFACPAGAITMEENESGEWFVSDTRFGPLVHARLGIAEENSGKLVSLVRTKAKELARANACDWVIVDGAPGIGCPVIASLAGVNCALVVTEPTLSGLHDADRVIAVTKHFKIPAKVAVNKYDLNSEMTDKIERYCGNNGVELIGKIPFDASVVEAMIRKKTMVEYSEGKAAEAVRRLWRALEESV